MKEKFINGFSFFKKRLYPKLVRLLIHVLICLTWLLFIPLLLYVLATYLNQSFILYIIQIEMYVGMGIHLFYVTFYSSLRRKLKDKSLYNWLEYKTKHDITREIIGNDIILSNESIDILELTQNKILDYVVDLSQYLGHK